MNNLSFKLILLTTISLLSACGGGSSSGANEDTNADITNTDTNAPTTRTQPTALSTNNWTSARLIQPENPMQNTVEVIGSELIINVESADISQGAHLQIYLNTDNKPETGFQFDNEAWEESGVDYLIEDGDLFKSTQNNSDWNWNVNIGAIDYTINTDTASAKIDLSLLGEICNNLTVGVMTRDEFWDISTFSPASSTMQQFTVSYCNTVEADTVKPEISLLGANPLNLNLNDTFIDPGATATDNIDGDVTNRIAPKSTVNVALAGTYEVSYLVTDIAGNSAVVSRVVIINEAALPEGIIVDGNTNDWTNIPALTSSADAIMKVSDDAEKLYILVTSSNLGDNIQILMDTDNNQSSGFNLSSQVSAWLAGADYMTENNSLDKSKSNNLWSWDYGIGSIEYIETADTLEIAIKKSDFNFLANKVPMGFVSRSKNWNVNYILPTQALPIYTLLFPMVVNPLTANNDSVTTPNNIAKLIDVRANDSSSTSSVLKVDRLLTQPRSGNAIISQNKVLYTPDFTFTGTVTFSYEISDSFGNRDTANIKIIVTAPVNTAPTAASDSSSTPQNYPIVIDVLANDSDSDGDSLTISSRTIPANGTTEIVNNKIIYTPNTDFLGVDTFTYVINDGNLGIDNAVVTVTVTSSNNPPKANDDSVTVVETKEEIIQVLRNDIDTDGDNLTILQFTQGTNGTVTHNPISSFVRYTANTGFLGNDTFSYTISDGNGGLDTATVSVAIIQNTPPIANDDFATTDGINTLRILIKSNDLDHDDIGVQLTNDYSQPSNGIVVRNTPSTLDYTPNPTFSGTDTFTYTIEDTNGATASATVSVTVPENNSPDAVEDVADVDFDKSITVNILSNDTDPDNDTLNVQSIVQPTVGIAILNADGSVFFTPQNNIGSISIGYTVSDGRGGTDFAVLTVASTDPNDGNDAYPDISNESVTTPKNTAIFIDVLANDSDADGDILILDQVDQGEHGTTVKINGGVRYTPQSGFVGTDIFYYGVHDGHGHNGAGFVEITVTQ